MITHVLKVNYLELTGNGPEEGPRLSLLKGDPTDPALTHIEITDSDRSDIDYLLVSVPVTDTNGMEAAPGDLVVLSQDNNKLWVTLIASPSDTVQALLIDSVEGDRNVDA